MKVIELALMRAGINASSKEINRAVNYLEDRGYLKVRVLESKALHLTTRQYSITADGVDVLEGSKTDDGVGVG